MKDGAGRAPWGMVGRSAAMEELRQEITRFAPSALSIHVYGETGTGKEVVARAVHAASGRRGRFVAFNAAGFTDELFDAELFGHTRGAFTGAVAAREGYVAAAEHGTLFLDEVAELSPRGQVKLLRFLEEREYRRLGETGVRRADVRVVSAANVDLGDRVAEGRFRQDLRYRLEGLRVIVPPLRERGDDVLPLLLHFLSREVGPGRWPTRLSREAGEALVRFPWPGNVRQLATEAQRLAVKVTTGVVEPRHLSPEVLESGPPAGGTLRRARTEFDRAYVRRMLERHRWNRTATAAALGISRQALVVMIRRLGLSAHATAGRVLSSPATGLESVT